MTRPVLLAPLLAVTVLLGGCSRDPAELVVTPTPATSSSSPSEQASTPSPSDSPVPPAAEDVAHVTGPVASDGRPRLARLSIPSLGLRDLDVVPYVGWTDDGPGTRIQDRGVAASPHGPRGGTGPGGIGNYQVTAHRTSSTRAFELVPELQPGDRVLVDVGPTRYVYRVTRTRSTSFRSAESLRRQRAAVPGRPGVEPTRAMLTLSTCATQEDHAAGNYWSDELHNPEHRIDKIAVLVAVRGR